MKILVTGSAGFIGSHVSEHLIKRGNSVVGIDNFDPFYPRDIKEENLSLLRKAESFHFYEGDIRDRRLLDHVFEATKPDAIIHLAAKAGVRPSIEAIEDYYDVNVTGTLSVLEAMKKHGVSKMIFASSSSVYGNNKKIPFSESDPVDNPISPYASTKKSGELLCHVYHHLHGFDITCLRFFTVYGPRQRPDLAIHKFVRLIEEGNPVPFFGDGTSGRDYTYIEDIVQGVLNALDRIAGFRIYNLGESDVITLQNLVTLIETSMGKKAHLSCQPSQPGDVRNTFADISLAQRELDYLPKYKINEGMARFIEWFRIKIKTDI